MRSSRVGGVCSLTPTLGEPGVFACYGRAMSATQNASDPCILRYLRVLPLALVGLGNTVGCFVESSRWQESHCILPNES